MSSSENKRIAKNTVMLYIRQLLTMLVSLFTVRIVLDVLGVEDYGIYSVVAGVVALFSFLSGSMAGATQRFFSYALGEKNQDKLNKTFSSNIIIYVIIAIFAVILLETAGLWFFEYKLTIPLERQEAASIVYHLSVLSFVATIFSAPFMSIMIAHEDMHYYAYISIFEVIFRLLGVYFLYTVSADKLKLYAILLTGISFINTGIYIFICVKKYAECQFKKMYWDSFVIKEILNYTGWALFGSITTIMRMQAVTILINQFFNPTVVAARAIASQIDGKINLFSAGFNTSLYPPIIKAYATEEKEKMYTLVFAGSRLTFFLMWVFALPLFLAMEPILELWLKQVPPYTVLFTRLALIESMITAVSYPVMTAARAPGKIRAYELILGSMQIGLFIVAWFVLEKGGEAHTVYYVAITINILMFFIRLYLAKQLSGLPIMGFLKNVILKVMIIATISFCCSYLIYQSSPKSWLFIGVSITFSVFISSILMYFLGLNKEWRKRLKDALINKLSLNF